MNRKSPHARPEIRYTDDGRALREVLTYARRGTRLNDTQQRHWDSYAESWIVDDLAGEGWSELFGREAPMVVEIGSGVGETAVAVAQARPEANVVAFEVWRPGLADTLGRIATAGLANVRLCSIDAVWAMEHLFAPSSLDELLTFFPDPWHKKRHHKRRLVTPAFAQVASSRLVPEGVWRLATDWGDYAEQMLEVLDAEPALSGGVVERWDGRPLTRFERRGVAEGRSITDLAYRRVE